MEEEVEEVNETEVLSEDEESDLCTKIVQKKVNKKTAPVKKKTQRKNSIRLSKKTSWSSQYYINPKLAVIDIPLLEWKLIMSRELH